MTSSPAASSILFRSPFCLGLPQLAIFRHSSLPGGPRKPDAEFARPHLCPCQPKPQRLLWQSEAADHAGETRHQTIAGSSSVMLVGITLLLADKQNVLRAHLSAQRRFTWFRLHSRQIHRNDERVLQGATQTQQRRRSKKARAPSRVPG